jgi:hypothetical protein
LSFYGEMQAVARDLLREFDQGGVVLSVATPGSGPAHNPGPVTFVDTAIDGTVRGVSAQYVDQVSVLASDLMVTIPGGVVVPKATDKVKLFGVSHNIVRIMPKPAQGTVAAYLIIVRK